MLNCSIVLLLAVCAGVQAVSAQAAELTGSIATIKESRAKISRGKQSTTVSMSPPWTDWCCRWKATGIG